jgi:hypothetical protein
MIVQVCNITMAATTQFSSTTGLNAVAKVYRRLARRQYDEEASVGIGAGITCVQFFAQARGEQQQPVERLNCYEQAANERFVERAEGQA